MEPGARGRSPVARRVTPKLSNDTLYSLPYRPRKDAAHGRKTAAVDIDGLDTGTAVSRGQDSEADPRKQPAAADALSLSGTTPPSSPTVTNFPAASKSMTPDSAEAGRPQLVLTDSHGKVAAETGDDAHFRKHNRGIGSIDSLLSSTTYVNTQSECSRAESRLSREIRIEVKDTDGGAPIVSHPKPKKQPSRVQLAPPSTTDRHDPVVNHSEGEGRMSEDEESRLVNEISSWVLRNTFGKDVDDCAAPLLVWDCTYRYLQELWAAAHEGNAGFIQTTSGHGTPSPHYGGTSAPGGNDQQNSGYPGKGKRKADGGSDGGSGFGGRDKEEDDERDVSPASQAYSSKANITNFSCPYRKRNPLRFNVRDYYVCATHSFADMSQLKKHIRAHHPPVQRNAGPFLCPRCCQGFVSKNELDSHLRQLEVCRVSYDSGGADPEDGITQKIISSLEARSLKAKIDNWVSLWKLLFPGDQVIPDPVFVPVMEVFDFITESRKFLDVLKDLLEIQYRHVLEGASQLMDVDLKIKQGLERSTSSIYNWIETVVQDWEQKIAGTVSLFTSSAISQPATSDSWASTPRLPPSPAPTPTVASGTAAASATLTGAESPSAPVTAAPRSTSARRRPNPQPKRIKRPEILPKAPPPTQIPLPVQRARTPQSQSVVASNAFRPAPAVLPSQSIPMPPSTTQGLSPGPPYQTSWDNTPVTVAGAYSVPYTGAGDILQHQAAPTHFGSINPNQLDVVQPSYLGPEQSETVSPDAMQHDVDPSPQSAATMHANRIPMSATPRSSLASLLWNRDENRDSSQTLVEAHPPGRCHNMYCPSCNKTLPDDMSVQPSPVSIHPATGPPQQHNAFQTVGTGQGGGPFQPSPGPGEIHSFGDQVEWYGGMHGVGGNGNVFGGGHHGPQEGY
ncbi:uncharacterized protein P884DRAFT_223240 [Thermothelomyces heterothallicus CBS 202.75]|uniref:uncharacterized protein n=1 Tax=Thermothelomyces heterothallicus CBS 202.75 TaxID=1149848 RepID=UPI0037448DCF